MAEIEMTYRGISFNTNLTGIGDTYMLIDIPEGLNHPVIRESERNIQGEHGISDQMSFYGKRLITLTGKIISDTQAGRKIMEEELKKIFILDGIQDNLNASYYPLFITDEDGELKQIDVKVAVGVEFQKIFGNYYERDFIVTLKARDPRILGQTLNNEPLEESFDGTTLQFPSKFPFKLGNKVFNQITINNTCNFSTPPIITLSGVSTNPRIINQTTGKQMKLNTDLLSGDEIVIDVALGTIEKNGADILSALDAVSEFIFLAPGENVFELRDDTPVDLLLQAEIKWRDAWIYFF